MVDQMKRDETNGKYDAIGKLKMHLENLSEAGRVILKWILKN